MRSIAPSANEDSGRSSFSIPESDNQNTLVLTAGVAKLIAIPEGAGHATFTGTADYWVKFGNDNTVVAAIPVADVTDGTSAELDPAMRQIRAGRTHISVVSAIDAKVNVCFFAK